MNKKYFSNLLCQLSNLLIKDRCKYSQYISDRIRLYDYSYLDFETKDLFVSVYIRKKGK